MSSRAPREHHKSEKTVDRSTRWSDWLWDPDGRRYYSYRQDANGEYEYQYQETPASVSSGPRTDSVATITPSRGYNSTTSDVPYTSNDNYGYDYGLENYGYAGSGTSAPATSYQTVESLTTSLANTAINEQASSRINEFQIISEPSRFFHKGRVFKSLWIEPAGYISENDNEFVVPAKFGEKAYTKVRHFVVVREMQGCCLCLPLNTYNRQGTTKPGIKAENYAAVYDARESGPEIGSDETLAKEPFPIWVEDSKEKIDPKSRLNFGRVYTVEHNIKVLKVGRIPVEYHSVLDRYFLDTMTSTSTDNSPSIIPSTPLSAPYSSFDYSSSTPTRFFPGYIPEKSFAYGLPAQSTPNNSYNVTYTPQSDSESYHPSSSVSNGNEIATLKSMARLITGTPGEAESLDPRFRIHHSSYFKPLQVFKVLWSEPESGTSGTLTTSRTDFATTKYGEKIYMLVRRFVIVAADQGHCQCIPILTYGSHGCTRPGVRKADHAVIHTGSKPPAELKGENLENRPVEVIPAVPRDKLAPQSRVNYAKIYTVEHNVKVCFIGRIADGSRRHFMIDFDKAWDRKRKTYAVE